MRITRSQTQRKRDRDLPSIRTPRVTRAQSKTIAASPEPIVRKRLAGPSLNRRASGAALLISPRRTNTLRSPRSPLRSPGTPRRASRGATGIHSPRCANPVRSPLQSPRTSVAVVREIPMDVFANLEPYASLLSFAREIINLLITSRGTPLTLAKARHELAMRLPSACKFTADHLAQLKWLWGDQLVVAVHESENTNPRLDYQISIALPPLPSRRSASTRMLQLGRMREPLLEKLKRAIAALPAGDDVFTPDDLLSLPAVPAANLPPLARTRPSASDIAVAQLRAARESIDTRVSAMTHDILLKNLESDRQRLLQANPDADVSRMTLFTPSPEFQDLADLDPMVIRKIREKEARAMAEERVGLDLPALQKRSLLMRLKPMVSHLLGVFGKMRSIAVSKVVDALAAKDQYRNLNKSDVEDLLNTLVRVAPDDFEIHLSAVRSVPCLRIKRRPVLAHRIVQDYFGTLEQPSM